MIYLMGDEKLAGYPLVSTRAGTAATIEYYSVNSSFFEEEFSMFTAHF